MFDKGYAELGQFVQVAEKLADMASYFPMFVTADVSPKNALQLKKDQAATVELADGTSFPATIKFISLEANPATNTFHIKLMATEPVPDHIGAGHFASITINLGEADGHSVTPALFELNKQGRLSLKHLDSDNRVISSPIEIIQSNSDSVWVSGLPKSAHIITQGHGFVEAGDVVIVGDQINVEPDE